MCRIPFAQNYSRISLLVFLLLAGCATSPSSPEAEPAAHPATAGPPPSPEAPPADVMMAMDPESDPEPPGGRPDVNAIGDTTLLLQSAGYDVVYSETKQNPLVVAYFLRPRSPADVEPCARPPNFLTDDRTAAKIKHDDYTNTGYDRGHMAPNSAIGRRHGCEAQTETFLMSNIAPQPPGLNQRTWQVFEDVVETEYAGEFEGIWVLTGPAFNPAEIVTLCETEVEVPVEFWKIVIRRKPDGVLDAAGVIMKKDERREVPIGTFSTTIDDIEARTGIDFFPDLPPAQELAMEAACPNDDWMLDRLLDATFSGTPRPICEEPTRARSQSLGTTVGQSPVCAQ